MSKNFLAILAIYLFFVSCSNKNTEDEASKGFPVLSYSAEISETLNLDPGNIKIDQPKEINYWSQHFLNPTNNLNNIYSDII